MTDALRVGTRRSSLAREQTRLVIRMLESVDPGVNFEVVAIRTEGDEDMGGSRFSPGRGKDVFTKAIEDRILSGEIDIAVHSLKDLPTVLHDDLVIGSIPKREDARDAVVSAGSLRLSELREGAEVGTSSLRRKAQLLANRPDLVVKEIHGNVETRLKKIRAGFDAVVLAAAGLIRLGLRREIAEYISTDVILPAAGQGALAVEARRNDVSVLGVIRKIEDPNTRAAVEAERVFVGEFGGGCNQPVAAYGAVKGDLLRLTGAVASTDGRQIIRAEAGGRINESQKIGHLLAEKLSSIDALKLVGRAT